MDREIDILEYPWWASFIGHVFLLGVSVLFIYAWYSLGDVVHQINQWQLSVLLVPPLIYFLFLFPNLICLYAVPRLLIFKEDHIVIVDPLEHRHVFSYHDITRLIVHRMPRWSEPTRWISSRFRARLYFCNNTFKVMFNPDGLSNFVALLEVLRDKGLGHVIQQK